MVLEQKYQEAYEALEETVRRWAIPVIWICCVTLKWSG